MARVDDPSDLPIKLERCSNGEFEPPPIRPVVAETQRRTRHQADRLARRLGMSRRRFLTSLCASALTLTTLDACAGDDRRSRAGHDDPDRTGPGGRYRLPPESTTEPAAAAPRLTGDEFVMDVQGHFLEFDLTRPEGAARGFWQSFPQAACGDKDPRSCFSIEHFLEEVFLKSDTSLMVLSAIPILGEENPLSIDQMERTRRIMRSLCDGDDRVLLHGQALPNLGRPPAALDAMTALAADHPITAWKVYTHQPADRGWFLDDHDPAAPQVGEAFLRRAADLRIPIVCVHKGLSGGDRFADPIDIGPAAAAHRDLRFVVYHSGYEISHREGAFEPGPAAKGVDRLVASLRRSKIKAGGNVYAELGSTWRAVMGDPDQAAHLLGKLVNQVGEDNVLWGTDSIWYGSPQDQIQAFRAFEITPEFQERFGYPALTPELKRKILGLNAARLYGVDPPKVRCPFTRQELQAAREVAPASFPVYGPTTAAAVRELVAAHGGWV